MKRITIILVLVLIVVGLSGCIDDNTQPSITSTIHSRFIGTWKQKDPFFSYTFTFFNDGTCSIPVSYIIQSVSGSWRLRNNQLTIDYTASGTPFTTVYEYLFSDNSQSLYLYDVAYDLHYNLTKQIN